MHACGNVWGHVCGILVQSMWKRLGACMRLLGAKYAVVGCKSMDTFGCMSMPFGCMSMDRLGEYAVVGCKYAETFGCMYAAVGCKFHNG